LKNENKKMLFYPVLPDCRKSVAYWKVDSLRPFVLLWRTTFRWRCIWSIVGLILTG